MLKILLIFVIPSLIILKSPIAFFIMISPISILNIILLIKKLKIKCKNNIFQKLIKVISHICFIIFHVCFLLLFITDYVYTQYSKAEKTCMKILGFTIIGCLLLGGMMDIL